MDKDEYEIFKTTQFSLLVANAKINALTTLVEIIYLRNGATREKFRGEFKRVTDAIVQKYLEKIGDQFPRLAAEIDQREKLPEIDQDFLDSLRPGDESEPPKQP